MHKNKTDCSFKNDFTPSCDKLALVSINTLVTRLVFISVSTKDVDTKYSIYYQVLSIIYSLDSSATDLNYYYYWDCESCYGMDP